MSLAQKTWEQEMKAKDMAESRFKGNEMVTEDGEDDMEVMPSVVMKNRFGCKRWGVSIPGMNKRI